MTTPELPPPLQPHDAEATTSKPGQSIDDGQGRIFPCEQCGADLVFHIGEQELKCPYCGWQKPVEIANDAEVREQNFHAMLERVRELRATGSTQAAEQSEVRCDSCGGTVVFTGTLTSTECPYCASPLQRDKVHDAEDRVPVDGVLPFLIDRKKAHENLAEWVKSRWFAPNDFLKRGVTGKFSGVYLPYWTYDTLTANRYAGERGEHYYVEVEVNGKKQRIQRTRWYPASGHFQRFFDDVMVLGTAGMNRELMLKLEPWRLDRCVPFNQEMLAGYFARTYEIDLDSGFEEAKLRIDAAIEHDVRQRIGGDTQRIHNIQSRYSAITFKHLLLPCWLLAYRYHETPYQVMVNASTGEVQGERPWSWVKITLAVIAAAIVIGLTWYFKEK